MPLTHATVQAIDVWCPQLHSLCVVQTSYAQYYDDEDPDGAGAAYLEACKQLMARCGPRLRNLKLHGVHGWGELCFMAVRHCTALTELDLEVRWMQDQPTTIAEETHGGGLRAKSLRGFRSKQVRHVTCRVVSRLARGARDRVTGRGIQG